MPAASSNCFIASLSRNGTVSTSDMPRHSKRFPDPGSEDHQRLPEGFDSIDTATRSAIATAVATTDSGSEKSTW